jgi:hypothetical protein
MPLSSVQKGAIGQFAFLATAMITGNGQVEAYTPAADNEGRDAEIRRHLKSSPGIGIQVKVTFFAIKEGRARGPYLTIRFAVAKKHLHADARLWYFLAFYDPKELRLQGPVFLIPSTVFHRMAGRGVSKGQVWFSMTASLAPTSRDRWSPFRVAPKDLGRRLLEIVDKTGLMAVSSALPHLPTDSVLVGRAKPRAARNLQGASKRFRAVPADPKYDLIRNAVLSRDSVSALYQGHLRLLSPFVLGTKAGDPHALAYQFGGTSHKVLAPDGAPENWRCLRVSELTEVTVLPGMWHAPRKGRSFQHCVDQVDVSAGRSSSASPLLRRAA